MSSRRFTLVVAGWLAGLLVAVSPGLSQGNSPASEANYPVEINQPGGFPPEGHEKGHPKEKPLHFPHIKPGAENLNDPVLQTSTPTPAAALGLGQWEGLGSAYPGFSITAVPPDTNLAVGPNHIVQWVNNALVIFDKQGNQLQAPVDDGTFWGAFSTCYQGGGFSDPIVKYDRAADRWVVAEVALGIPGFFGQYAQCFAVSKTSDPTWTSDANGNNTSYNIWAYGFGSNINDYDKLSVWPDAYYVTWNIFQNGTTFIGPEVCAWDRSAMLNGAAAPAFKCFQLNTNYASVLPADLDGTTPPPAGSPNFLMDINPTSGALDLWTFHVNTANFSNSTLSNPTSIPVAPFTVPCLNAQTGQISQDCIPQDGTTQMVDALGDRLMYRLAYRNFGDHESLVANHTVMTAGGNTGVRWYEVRSPNSTPTLYQQGTFAPDSDNRWMASIAMDQSGNIGVGYSVASAATFDSIRYTGWQVGDTLGTLEAESSLVAGGGAQVGANRWGDYSAMQVDPSDDCTFWYTQEYEATTDPSNIIWNTRIGSFKFSSCGLPLVGTSTALITSGSPSTYGQSVTFTATVTSGSGTPAGNVTFKDSGTTLGSSALNASGVATLTLSTLAAGGHSISAVYDGDSTFSGSTSSAVTQTVNKDNTTTSVTSNLNPSTYGQSVQLTATVSPVAPATTTPTGTVTFFDGATSLGSAGLSGGTASISTAGLSAGSHTITASYGGDTNYNTSTSSQLTQNVSKANSTTTVVGVPNSSNYGQSVKFTATVAPVSPATTTPTGTVTFYDSGTSLGSAPLSGGTASISIASLSGGIHSITANYGGDTNYNTSASQPYAQTVNKVGSTTTLASSLNPSTSGQAVTFSATVSPATATGTVQFFDGGLSLGTQAVSGGTAKLTTSTLAVGTHNITATYSGDTNYSGSNSNTVSQTVNSSGTPDFTISASPASQTVSRGSSTSYTANVAALNSFTGTVKFSVSGLPSRSTASFNPTSVAGHGNSTLTVHAASKTPRGTFTLTIKGTSGALVHTTTVQLTVQ